MASIKFLQGREWTGVAEHLQATPSRTTHCEILQVKVGGCAQLEGLAERLAQAQSARKLPGKGRADEEFYLTRLSADAERKAVDALRQEV
jgi:hypothetical protein